MRHFPASAGFRMQLLHPPKKVQKPWGSAGALWVLSAATGRKLPVGDSKKEKDHGPLKAQTESSTDFLLGNPSPHRTRDRQGCRSLVKSLSCRGTGAAGRRRQNISPAFTDPPAWPPPYRPARSPPPRCRRPGAAWSPSPGYRCPHPWRRRGTGHPAGARSPP